MNALPRRFNALPQEQRFLIAVMLIVGIVVFGFYLTIARSFSVLDETLIEKNLQTRMQQFIENHHQRGSDTRMPNAAGFTGYIDGHPLSPPLPEALRSLPVKPVSMRLILDNGQYHALHSLHNGHHYYLLLDSRPLDNLKQFILLTAIEFVTIAVLASLVIARWLGHLISRPLNQLAGAVKDYRLDDAEPRKLTQQFRDNDMVVIANAFDGFVEKLTEFVSREQAFTQDASHELRTPLSIILSSLQLLAEDKSIGVSGQLRLARIQRAAENMQSLIEALLWLSREDAAASMPQEDLAALVQDLLQSLSDQVARKPIALEFRNLATYPHPVAKGMASSVVGNLVINAINHTDQGRITVTLRDDELEVHDTGHGIPAEDITHIFERRYRGSLSRGQGLGLYIVKRICRHLSWEVSVSSTPGVGTRFVIRFGDSTTGCA